MTIEQAHEKSGKHVNTIRNAIRNGKLKVEPVYPYAGKDVFYYDIDDESFNKWLGER